MKKLFSITSFSDTNFLKLGIFCIALGIFVYALSLMFRFSPLIALRGGLGLGLIICATYALAKFFKK